MIVFCNSDCVAGYIYSRHTASAVHSWCSLSLFSYLDQYIFLLNEPLYTWLYSIVFGQAIHCIYNSNERGRERERKTSLHFSFILMQKPFIIDSQSNTSPSPSGGLLLISFPWDGLRKSVQRSSYMYVFPWTILLPSLGETETDSYLLLFNLARESTFDGIFGTTTVQAANITVYLFTLSVEDIYIVHYRRSYFSVQYN